MSTQRVQDLYDRFPYPFPGKRPVSEINGGSIFAFLARESGAGTFDGASFLDAGCGSGQRVIDIARAFPKANFHAFDLSEKSLAVAREQAEASGLRNIQFRRGNILDYDPGQQFDYVVASGCLQHLEDPAAGVRNLAQRLAPDGLLVAWLHHSYGESDRMRQREALLALLGSDRENMDRSIELMRGMGLSLSPDRYGKSYGKVELSAEEQLAKDVDAFLHPQVTLYTFEDAMRLFSVAPLDWAAIEQINFEGHGYFLDLADEPRPAFWSLDMKPHVGGEEGMRRYLRLSPRERLHLVELLTCPTGFTLFAGTQASLARVSGRTRQGALRTVGRRERCG